MLVCHIRLYRSAASILSCRGLRTNTIYMAEKMSSIKTTILDVMQERPMIGDGSYVMTLEKRGYIKAGPFFTVETVMENPEAVEQLHRDFIRAGSDVIQTLTFYASGGNMNVSGSDKSYKCDEVNQKACDIAKGVAAPEGAFICGGLSPIPKYTGGEDQKEEIQAEYAMQLEIFVKNDVDFILGEFFGRAEEAVWCIEAMKQTGKPVACTMRMGPCGDLHGVPPGECAVRMAKAGADILGLNCQYDPKTCLKTLRLMKEGLDKAGLHPFLMVQALGFHCPEVEDCPSGYHVLPEYPFALEPRLITRFDARAYAREAYELGARYIGGCCGFEPYHIREMAEELAKERGKVPPGHNKWDNYGNNFKGSKFSYVRKRTGQEYWTSIQPASGRPLSAAASVPLSEHD